MHKKTIRDIDIEGKTILARLDWNVPVKDGEVVDPYRIESTRDTLQYLWEHHCKIVITSHLGRPDGKPDPKYSLAPAAKKAAEIFGRPVKFQPDCIGPDVEAAVRGLQEGEMLCLENVRFHPEEEKNDPEFAKKLASLADIFVYDAFASYRPHASTEGVAHFLPAVAGLLVEKEVDYITGAVEHPHRPLVSVIGGAKVSTKMEILTNLIPKVDIMLLTGPIANTFAAVQGLEIGQSVSEKGLDKEVRKLLRIAKDSNTKLRLPAEVVVSKKIDGPEDVRTVELGEIDPDTGKVHKQGNVAADDYIVDAAPGYASQLKVDIYAFLDIDGASTVIWNGPLGITEIPEFQEGSLKMANAIIDIPNCTSIIGGGDTAGFVNAKGLHDKFTWVSTGGGASLELMGGGGLPCVEALENK
ncbi:MAG TPA: phosphoglycerate kinase [Candidatus Saccharimonadia bacterium]|nr:phosphoglycerate kinase [Candidatus Saccharimonadia bacterium]